MTATTPMHDACGCDKCSDARIGGHFTAGGPPPATGRPRDYFTREAVTGGMPTEPSLDLDAIRLRLAAYRRRAYLGRSEWTDLVTHAPADIAALLARVAELEQRNE